MEATGAGLGEQSERQQSEQDGAGEQDCIPTESPECGGVGGGLLGAVMVARESVTEGLDVEGTQDIPDSEQRLGHKKTEFRCHQFNI